MWNIHKHNQASACKTNSYSWTSKISLVSLRVWERVHLNHTDSADHPDHNDIKKSIPIHKLDWATLSQAKVADVWAQKTEQRLIADISLTIWLAVYN